jgi:ubiquinone/menaquinone biosynthesis C-methylase UbiE
MNSSRNFRASFQRRFQKRFQKRFQNWAPPQRDRAELLDRGRASKAQIRQSLHDLRRVNLWLGNSQIVVNEIIALLKKRGLKRATILDVGTGSADLPIHLLRAAQKHNLDLKVIALDCKRLHLQIAREELRRERADLRRRVLVLGGDAFRLPLENASVDLVVSSLFLHHFRPPQIELLLNEFSRVARHGFVMNDLVRHYVPMVFFKATWPIFARSHLTRYDGAASFRRGYTIEEMQSHLSQMRLGTTRVTITPHFFRMSVIGEKL